MTDLLLALPEEVILEKLLPALGWREFVGLGQTCRGLRELTHDSRKTNELWARLYAEEFIFRGADASSEQGGPVLAGADPSGSDTMEHTRELSCPFSKFFENPAQNGLGILFPPASGNTDSTRSSSRADFVRENLLVEVLQPVEDCGQNDMDGGQQVRNLKNSEFTLQPIDWRSEFRKRSMGEGRLREIANSRAFLDQLKFGKYSRWLDENRVTCTLLSSLLLCAFEIAYNGPRGFTEYGYPMVRAGPDTLAPEGA